MSMNRKTTSGMTIIELLIAIAIFSILAAIAVPNIKSFMRNTHMTSSTNDLVTALNLARSEAVKRAQSVKACISNGAQDDCDTGTSNWENGWLVFVDLDNDDVIDAGETVLRSASGPGGDITIRSPQFSSTISFNRDGSANSIGSFKICNDLANASTARGINISLTGNISSAPDTNSDGTNNIFTDASGTWGEISCP